MKTKFPKLVPSPWLIPEVISFLTVYLQDLKSPKILEFGSGCSTAFFAQYLGDQGQLISIEHNPAWYEHVRAYLIKHNYQTQVELRLVSNNCAQECAKFAPDYFDLIFIDAKDRLACLQAARSILKPGGVLMFDDSQMRVKYQAVDQIMSDWPKFELVGTKSNPLDLTQGAQVSATAWWVKPRV